MEYLVLNEESLPFKSIEDSNSALPVFFKLVSEVFRNNFTTILVSDNFDSGWYNLLITPSSFLREWIQNQDIDYKLQLKTLISKTVFPRIPINELAINEQFYLSDFMLKYSKSIKTPSLGVAYLLRQIAISFNSASYWDLSFIELIQTTIDDKSAVVEDIVTVGNIADVSHWREHLVKIEEQRRNNNRKGNDLWENRSILFPHLIFCGKTEKQITNLSISDALFNKFWHCLQQLNNNINACESNSELFEKTLLTITDESESVKNNPKLRRYREFSLSDNVKHFFGLHIKNFPGAYRLHFLPDYNKNCIYIGYFGKHLPL